MNVRINWLGDPYWAIHAAILADVWKTTPFVILLLLAGMQVIPEDLYSAARIDGCSHFGILRHVVLPLAAPGLVSVGLLVFIFSWNEFPYALTLTASERSRTLPVAIALFPGVHEIPWGEIAAAGVLATLPTVVLVDLHGGQTHVELDLGGFRITSVESTDAGCRPGQKVWIAIMPDRWHFFDGKTGARILAPLK